MRGMRPTRGAIVGASVGGVILAAEFAVALATRGEMGAQSLIAPLLAGGLYGAAFTLPFRYEIEADIRDNPYGDLYVVKSDVLAQFYPEGFSEPEVYAIIFHDISTPKQLASKKRILDEKDFVFAVADREGESEIIGISRLGDLKDLYEHVKVLAEKKDKGLQYVQGTPIADFQALGEAWEASRDLPDNEYALLKDMQAPGL